MNETHPIAFRTFFRRYWPFAAAGLFLLLLFYPWIKQRHGAIWVEKKGGWVRTQNPGWLDRAFPERARTWLAPPKRGYHWWLPFVEVTWVDLYGVEMSDDDLRRLANFPHLEVARLNNKNITGNNLIYLRDLPELHTLTLQNTAVTDTEMAIFADGFPSLRTLLLCDTAITDACIEYLGQRRDLHSLSCADTSINKEGVERMRKFATVVGPDGNLLPRLPSIPVSEAGEGQEPTGAVERLELSPSP